VGEIKSADAIHLRDWPQERDQDVMKLAIKVENILPFPKIFLNEALMKAFKNGAFLKPSQVNVMAESQYYWMVSEAGDLLGLSEKVSPEEIRPKINFHSVEQVSASSDHDPL
jgi:hypothetical protein